MRKPVAGDVGEAAHVDRGLEQLAHRAHVDHRGLEQRLADACAPPSSGGALVEVRQRRRASVQPVRVDAARGQARHGVAGLDALRRSRSRRGPRGRRRSRPGRSRRGEGWPRISSGSTASSPPGISTPACSAPRRRPIADLPQRLRVGLLDRDVVEQRDRLGARRRRRRWRSSPRSRCPPCRSARAARTTITFVPTPSQDSARPRPVVEAQHVGVVAGAERRPRRPPGARSRPGHPTSALTASAERAGRPPRARRPLQASGPFKRMARRGGSRGRTRSPGCAPTALLRGGAARAPRRRR